MSNIYGQMLLEQGNIEEAESNASAESLLVRKINDAEQFLTQES